MSFFFFFHQKLEWLSVSASWTLGFLADKYICVLIALSSPRCRLPCCALKPPGECVNLLLAGISCGSLALPRNQQAGAGPSALQAPAGSHSAFPPGPCWASRTVSCRELFAVTRGHHSLVLGACWGQVYLISHLSAGAFSGQCKQSLANLFCTAAPFS